MFCDIINKTDFNFVVLKTHEKEKGDTTMMKKTICILIVLLLTVSSLPVFSDNPITVTLNGKLLQTPVDPMIVNDSTMVPFRVIFEALEMNVNWSEALQKVYAMNGEKTIILTIGSDKMLVNTEMKTLPAAPFISNGHTLVPVRAISEAMGCDVSWDSEKRRVSLKTEGYVEPDTENPSDVNPSQPDEENPFIPIIDDTPAYVNKNNEALSSELIELINATRIEYGLDALISDENLSLISLAHCIDMAEYDYIDHISPTGVDPFDRLDIEGIYYMSAAENIASGFLTAQKVLESWMNSAPHRQNILNGDFTHIGVGYHAGGSNGTYWTLMLIER